MTNARTDSSTAGFYSALPVFTDFAKVVDADVYTSAPDDWSVFVTDVKGSTKAVSEGRYREVNMVGAAGIAALLNVLKDVDLPFVFGGDGATLLVPNLRLEEATAALRKTQGLSKREFGLELRAGFVAVRTLRDQGVDIKVAKYELSPGNHLAQFTGGGIARAEDLVKSAAAEATLIAPDELSDPDLSGLSCRWEPFRSRRGVMLSLLVLPRRNDSQHEPVGKRVIREIEDILGYGLRDANPVRADRMRMKWPPSSLGLEAAAQAGGRPRMVSLLSAWAQSLWAFIFFRWNFRIAGLTGAIYKQQTERNADFKKFDDTLRMVIDCTHDQTAKIVECLERLSAADEIHFGVHRSEEALMTCLVFSAVQGHHLHFIDGGQGGYTMAAKMLKESLRAEGRTASIPGKNS